MFDPTAFRELVSGRRRGLLAGAARCLLRAGEMPYAWAMSVRNACYAWHLARAHRVAAPVVSVGNLTMGGTGKTPMVAWLARWFDQHDVPLALVSRGYKAGGGAQNDEALELAHKLPGVPHLQNPDRVAAARQAIADHGARLILLDDAFQHRRIHRDLDIVLLDALEPFGWEHVFPRGTLREPLRGLARADLIALSRADAVPHERRHAIRARVRQWAPEADWIEIVHQPACWLSSAGQTAEIASLADRPVAAFCGIGNPAGFRHTLQACACRIVDFRAFPDHHDFSAQQISDLDAWAGQLESVAAIICTHKDLVKIGRETLGPHPLWALSIEVAIREGRDRLQQRLDALREQAR